MLFTKIYEAILNADEMVEPELIELQKLIEKKIEACREKCFDRRIKTCGPIRDSA
jgi:hypothetical protein